MKKNITINLCGRLFQIDEDAYELLQQYIESLRQSFGHEEGGEEIVNDIEARIAELFEELNQQGIEAITIEHVKDIITRIGKPEELTGEEEKNDSENGGHKYDSFQTAAQGIKDNFRARTAGKRLYRNPNDKMLAGVLSGIATYTGSDVTWWRIGFVLLLLASNFFLAPILHLFHFGFYFHVNLAFVILYIVLAIVLPVAETPKQVLEMEGKDVTPQNLADVVIEDKEPVQRRRGCLGSVFSVIFSILAAFFVAIASIVGVALLVCLLLIIVSLVVIFTVPSVGMPLPFDLERLDLPILLDVQPWIVIVFIVGLILALTIPLYAIGHMLFSKAGKVQPMGIGQRILWIVLWVASLCCLFPALVWIEEQEHKEYQELMWKKYSYQGVMMSREDKKFLRREGWKVIKAENCAHLTSSGEHWSGDPNARYIDAWNEDCEEVYQVEHPGQTEPGLYRLDCLVRAEGPGAFIYAKTGNQTVLKQIPAYGNTGGEFVDQCREELAKAQKKDSTTEKRLRSTTTFDVMGIKFYINDYEENSSESSSGFFGEGKGWSLVSIDSLVVADGTITWGVSTDEKFTGQPCRTQWFSATGFKVTRIGDLPKQKK